MNSDKSIELFNKSKTCIPGGVNSPVRAFQAVKRTPVFIEKANGSKIYDVDGNEYIDYVCSWGPSILGHTNRSVVEAVKKACEKGLTFGAPTENEYVLVKLISEMIPSMEMTRLVSSGTEAVMSAIRAARGYTNRDAILKFSGCYHGHSDGLLVKAGSGALTQSVPNSKGVPNDYTKNTLIAEYNNEKSVEDLFKEYGDKIAAVIIEPVAANMGVVLPKKGFLQFLREITIKYNALLIFDEVITGFRLGTGGAQEYFGVTPDLTTLGKIIGGGMPVGAYGGKKQIMEVVSPVGHVYQAGTLSGNPIATAAGIATLNILKNTPDIYKRIELQTNKIVNAVKERFGDEVCVNNIGSLMSIFFTSSKVVDFSTAITSDTNKFAHYFGYLLEKGIYMPPSQFEAMFISCAHTDDDINKTSDVIKNYPNLN
ncbi:glutamate-1-semialdehyde 2,1-aminomutase [Clostridium homopropionicum DSM 5847]|uniref:Glutamate-1-semialdehyde 2,1-aminomutase n=1 Tax=Clostridium homopropionicum DSM 5847 TaxID=1121318 RepID=A0A0L6ZD39_9CLOT|nr:glutamate-1-semialdehyde 2,1-aminomutase [Clostridium homopropionicum]KOA20693.1 glutamate-1-semialdehyde 2,1-aminomutase [Clostridium homopropionicum DSM 5847]SFF91326.1 glutamate-1-semialdehyde 2,1-aminomutase [Clostridium homopropionicum]